MTAFSSTTGAPPTRDTTVPPGARTMQPRGASTTYYTRGLVMHRVGSDIVEHPLAATPRTDLVAVGIVVGQTAAYVTGVNTDSSGGALDANGYPDSITAETGIVGWFDTGTGSNQITNANVDQICYAFDNNTLYLTNLNGTLSAAGYVVQVRKDGKVKLRIDPSVYLIAQDALPSATVDGSARAAATNLPAGTFSAGVFTVTATGALPSQDGVTIALGDIVVFPLGTITTQAVSAANSGPYECTVLGATGVSAVLARPAWFAHGAVITPECRVRVGGEGAIFPGTTWRADPATATKKVGTDDPLMFPERVVVQKTLASGTATIATVPLRGAGKFGVYIDFNGGTPAATTTSLQASTQTPGGIGTASIVIQEQSVLGTLVNTGTAQCAVTILQ